MAKRQGEKGMKSATLPKDHWERDQGELGHECKEKYATEMGNPADLDRANAGLADYVRKNKMKY